MKKCIFVLLLCLPFLSSCWNAKEISDLAIATGIGIDLEEDGKYTITVQIINTGEVAAQKGSGRAEVTSYVISAPTIYEALRKLTIETPKRIYLSHVQMIVLGETVARKGIKESIDFLSRDHEFRSDFYLLIARETSASSMLNVMTPMQKVPAISMYTQLEVSAKRWAPTVVSNLDDLISDLIADGKDPFITGVRIKGETQGGGIRSSIENIKPPSIIELKGVGAFKGDQLVGWLTQKESAGLNYLLSNVESSVEHTSCPSGNRIVMEITSAKTKVKSSVSKGKPHIVAEMEIEANVGEVQCKIDLSKPKTVALLERKTEQRIIELAKAAVAKGKEYESDMFGFGESIHRQHPKEWKKLKKDWTKHFTELEVSYDVNVEIRRIGTISNSIYEQVEE